MMSGLTAAMFGMQVKLLWGKRRDSFAAHFMLMTLVLLCAVMMARVTSALIDPPPVGLFTYSPLQAIYLASYSFGVLLLSISAILLSSEQLRNEMAKLLKYDALTGALTRRSAFEYGENELARSSRSGTVFSVLLIDLDHFKEINDKYGHQKGDVVLTEFVQRVEQVLRRPSVMGRYGGEEFIVLLPDTTKEKAVQVAERIQNHLRAHAQQPKVTASIGVASFSQAQGDNLDTMIGRADTALYAAKNNGRDQIVVDEML
jgi:diguanylate cyclase (GGDEF)-like protein